ncbi:hypothetical protein L0668_00715 [Paraglaciecola aquimarina]|uniref:Uncharacterized protein n=1 Tax=Paraglaciecola algarum TaxID=3050085 RepID=A0ABS9D470_9ALTE|nr:hypothetical protein [Paraglaciecola sp. G1-23]MCF2946614.1 hypothetical protein [Paraglaciecola sp. G1-23]
MKKILINIFSPILNIFENANPSPNYKKSHRTALVILGGIFIFLSCVSATAAIYAGVGFGAAIPIIVFFSVGLVALVVGSLGSNQAVSKIWGTK